MCGICGFVSSKEEIAKTKRAVIKTMTDCLEHRGPDDDGYFWDDFVSLGMRRLSIIDLTGGHQPIFSEDKSKCIIANGEIYNFKELRKDLEARGHEFRTNTDIETILHLYEDSSTQCLDRLNGMFAFVIYDAREHSLFIARDRLGLKPLHYYFHNNDFVFASEIKSILKFPRLKQEVNLAALNQYLTFEYIPAPKTIYKDIHKLQQGHFMIFKDNAIQLQRYWNVNFKDKTRLTEQQSIEQLRYLMEDAVKLRLVSDVPLGAFLSGGIDSSLVVALMRRLSTKKVLTFNICFKDKDFDESSYAQLASRYIGTQHHERRLTPGAMLEIIPRVIDLLDEPFADASIIPTYLLSQFTREHVTVALTGDGGDELFAGYPTYQAHRIVNFLPPFIYRPLQSLADRFPVSDDNISFDFKLKRILSGNKYPPAIRNQIWLGSFSPEEKTRLFLPDIYNQTKPDSEFEVVKLYQSLCLSENSLDKILYQDLQLYLQDNMLLKVDRATMANSLEARSPYLDHRLVEFAGSLPSNWKLKFLSTKYIFKKSATGLLPSEIISRPKKGFGVPVAKWLKNELRGLLLEILSENRIKKQGLFNFAYIDKLIGDHLANRKDNRKLLWTLLVLEMWLSAKTV